MFAEGSVSLMSNTTSSIITIGREYGSGGRQIGQEVAKIFLALNAMIKNFWSGAAK